MADKSLSDFGYDLIVRGRYKLARDVLGFGVSCRDISSDRLRRMMVVNLANAIRLDGNPDEARVLLEKEDWSATDETFAISVAAVLGDLPEVVRLIHNIGQKHPDLTLSAYQEWPVFIGVRDEREFIDAIESVFGLGYNPSPAVRNLGYLFKSDGESQKTDSLDDHADESIQIRVEESR